MNIQRLAYHYAQILLETGECVACFTCSYEITEPDYIQIPSYRDEYVGTYYNFNDGKFYYDSDYTQLFDPNAI